MTSSSRPGASSSLSIHHELLQPRGTHSSTASLSSTMSGDNPKIEMAKRIHRDCVQGKKDALQAVNEICKCMRWDVDYVAIRPVLYEAYHYELHINGQCITTGGGDKQQEAKRAACSAALKRISTMIVEGCEDKPHSSGKTFMDVYGEIAFGKLKMVTKEALTLVGHVEQPAHFAAFIVTEHGQSPQEGTIVAFGTGNHILPLTEEDIVAGKGCHLIDMRALTVAKRAFQMYLASQLKSLLQKPENRFDLALELEEDGKTARFRSGYRVHLFLSHAPDGDATFRGKEASEWISEKELKRDLAGRFDDLTAFSDSQCGRLRTVRCQNPPRDLRLCVQEFYKGEIMPKEVKRETVKKETVKNEIVKKETVKEEIVKTEIVKKEIVNRENSKDGIRQIKICKMEICKEEENMELEVNSSGVQVMSLSDKLLSWCHLGFQGSLLGQFFRNPIRPYSIQVGMNYSHVDMARAVYTRLPAEIQFENQRLFLNEHLPVNFVVTSSNDAYLGRMSQTPTNYNYIMEQYSFNWFYHADLKRQVPVEAVSVHNGSVVDKREDHTDGQCSRLSRLACLQRYHLLVNLAAEKLQRESFMALAQVIGKVKYADLKSLGKEHALAQGVIRSFLECSGLGIWKKRDNWKAFMLDDFFIAF